MGFKQPAVTSRETNIVLSNPAGGHAIALLVQALCYKPEGRGFDSRCHWIF
jgi:hypothetical protein